MVAKQKRQYEFIEQSRQKKIWAFDTEKSPPSEDQLTHLNSDHLKSVHFRSVPVTENAPTNQN